ncbi:energy transducer TonB [Henriciella marina]|uniref:Energy transducer TonB n=1 Tax=Henriciella marina TaxID=453851 RepID=A0ABT4LQY4_9PROT|nr:energy transducer TonB [Henriciella marina]MCZ4296766.1 energy transducer TonB [Henriciella marina]
MRFFHPLPGALLLAGLAACAVDPYAPAPIDQRGVNAPVGQEMGVQPGQIAACGHAGAPVADLRYPDGWQARLSQGPTMSSGGGGDELLGGVSEPDAVVGTDVLPIVPPQPVYPASALDAGQEGRCEILMDVSPAGAPQNILTACSAPQFNAPTYQAATGLRFDPPREGGRSVRLVNVVYPISYCMDQ